MKQKYLTILLGVMGMWLGPQVFAGENGTTYSPLGKRDPFQVPKLVARDVASPEKDLFLYPVEQFQLKAILKGGLKTQILIEDPKGKNYVLEEGAVLGRGRATVSRILDKEVILTERGVNYLGVQGLSEKVLSLSQDEETGAQ